MELKNEHLPMLSADEQVHREILKQIGPLKSYSNGAKENVKKLRKMHVKPIEFDPKKNNKNFVKNYKEFNKHKERLIDIFKEQEHLENIYDALDKETPPYYRGENLAKTFDHARIKREKYEIMVKKANLIGID